jgi:hypothetical protein
MGMGWELGPSQELDPSQVRAPGPSWGPGNEEKEDLGEVRDWEVRKVISRRRT